MSVCTNHWLHQHRYEPRYDTGLPRQILDGREFEGTVSTIEAMKDKTYVRDVCTRCGDVIERAA